MQHCTASLAGDGRAGNVRDGGQPCAELAGCADSCKGIGCFAVLADGQQLAAVKRLFAISEFRRELQRHRQPREQLDHVLSDKAGMTRRSAGGDGHAPERVRQVCINWEKSAAKRTGVRVYIGTEGVLKSPWLLVDFLQHINVGNRPYQPLPVGCWPERA